MQRTRPLHPPTEAATVEALRRIGGLLDRPVAYHREGRFYFRLDASWTLAVSADSIDRFRLDACHKGHRVASLWSRSGDAARLADRGGRGASFGLNAGEKGMMQVQYGSRTVA